MKIGQLLDVEPHDSIHFKTEPYLNYAVECKIASGLRDMANKIQYLLFTDLIILFDTDYLFETSYENR